MRIKAFVFLIFSFCASFAQAGDKTIGVLVWDGVLTSDITGPLEVFGQASTLSWFTDYKVSTINVGEGTSIKTHEGLSLAVDAHLKDSPKVDVLLVPSSYDMDPILKSENVIGYIRDTATRAEWMASNCSGAFALAKAGVLDGKKATTWAGGEGDLKKDYPKVDVQFDTNVVVDKGVITSNGSLVSYQAALILLAKLASPEKAQEVADALQYSRFSQQPFKALKVTQAK
jgi:transcriptional regulator GlxA family with amidase domain